MFTAKRHWRDWVVLAALAALVAGCALPGTGGGSVKADSLQSDLPRLPALSPSEANLAELVAGNTAFAVDLFGLLSNRSANLFFSPYSISAALAMTYAGARAETESQMAEALHFDLPQLELHAAFNALDRALLESGMQAIDGAFKLHIVNAIWGQQDASFLKAFLDTLAQNYGAGMQLVDFAQSEEARQLINGWVEQQTENRIQELLPPRSVDAETALVLTNAVYFKAAWMHAFPEARTAEGPFTRLDGRVIQVPMMSQQAQLGYAEFAGWQAVDLPYADGRWSMVALLPTHSGFDDASQYLTEQVLAQLLDRLQTRSVQLTMPKFRAEASLKLQDALVALGMTDAFGPAADFSGMDGTKELFIDQVYHKAVVAVDEAGTEAAAATAVVMGRKGLAAAEQEVILDRPFVFLIRDQQTGTILFLGHVVDPSSE